MDDMIYRKDAAKILCNWCGVCPEDKRDIMNCDDICPEFARIPSAQQWIPCSERLPEQNGKYLVVGRQKAINILKFDGGRWYGKWGVVAWMPLPEPYQPKENEQ